jgi:VCBS repeat-containing protein
VNDAPVNTVPGAQSVNEDTTLPISGLSVADVDGDVLTTTLAVAHGTLSATGTGVSGSGSATLTIAGEAAEINAALATPQLSRNLNFHGSDTLTITTTDGSLSDADTVAITVKAVDDAPVNTVPGAQSVDEDTVLPVSGLAVADVDTPGLVTTAHRGARDADRHRRRGQRQRHRDHQDRGPGGEHQLRARHVDLSRRSRLHRLRYADRHHVGRFVERHRHGGDHGQRGERSAGQHGPGRANRQRGQHAADRGVSVADVDSSPLTTTLTVASGTLNVAIGGGATVGGNGSNSITISGTATEINDALAGLSYLVT